MIKNKTEWGNCPRCWKEITENNFGDCIEAEETLVCDSCAEKHNLFIIGELNKFRQSKKFNDRLALINKILWASEEKGYWYDAGDKSYIENVSDYESKNVFELQLYIIEIELLSVKELLAEGDFGFPTKDIPELQALIKELLKEKKRLVSYLEK